MSVNGGLLPTCSELPPDLHRKIFFCTFADVEECPDARDPKSAGGWQMLNDSSFSLWQNQKSAALGHTSAVASVPMFIQSARTAKVAASKSFALSQSK